MHRGRPGRQYGIPIPSAGDKIPEGRARGWRNPKSPAWEGLLTPPVLGRGFRYPSPSWGRSLRKVSLEPAQRALARTRLGSFPSSSRSFWAAFPFRTGVGSGYATNITRSALAFTSTHGGPLLILGIPGLTARGEEIPGPAASLWTGEWLGPSSFVLPRGCWNPCPSRPEGFPGCDGGRCALVASAPDVFPGRGQIDALPARSMLHESLPQGWQRKHLGPGFVRPGECVPWVARTLLRLESGRIDLRVRVSWGTCTGRSLDGRGGSNPATDDGSLWVERLMEVRHSSSIPGGGWEIRIQCRELQPGFPKRFPSIAGGL